MAVLNGDVLMPLACRTRGAYCAAAVLTKQQYNVQKPYVVGGESFADGVTVAVTKLYYHIV